jgi:hypothetical protein
MLDNIIGIAVSTIHATNKKKERKENRSSLTGNVPHSSFIRI